MQGVDAGGLPASRLPAGEEISAHINNKGRISLNYFSIFLFSLQNASSGQKTVGKVVWSARVIPTLATRKV